MVSNKSPKHPSTVIKEMIAQECITLSDLANAINLSENGQHGMLKGRQYLRPVNAVRVARFFWKTRCLLPPPASKTPGEYRWEKHQKTSDYYPCRIEVSSTKGASKNYSTEQGTLALKLISDWVRTSLILLL